MPKSLRFSSNLVFKHGDARFHVNKAVLCAHSPVLEAALSEDPGITEYVHPKQDEEHTTEGFKLFFECIYDPDGEGSSLEKRLH